MRATDTRLFVCYVPGLDLRRIDPGTTPNLHRIMRDLPSVSLRTLPSTELVPTLITGVWPAEHGIWQVSLKRDEKRRSLDPRSLVPDWLSTTWQCLRHLADPEYDLAAIPWRRRRHFNLHRFKYTRRQHGDLRGPTASTIFDWVGDGARYEFVRGWKDAQRLLDSRPSPDLELDLLEFYAFDVMSHWNLDRSEVIAKGLRRTDELVGGLASRCAKNGVTFMLLIDHGQERITRTVDLAGLLAGSGIGREACRYFIEVGVARLWFETEDARSAIVPLLEATAGIQLYRWDEMGQFHAPCADAKHGEYYVIADHGVAFFPHDFYQPLANLYLGLTRRAERPRLRDPRHRANHGQHPDHPAEQGILVLADPSATSRRETVELIDFAPTVLNLLGRSQPEHLAGEPAFRVAPN